MTDDQTSPNLRMPYIQPAQAQKHITHNEALRVLDAVVQLAVQDGDRTQPPAAPGEGDRHLVADGSSGAAGGAWAGRENALAVFENGAWTFQVPRVGWLAWVAAQGELRVWTGTAWEPIAAGAATSDILAQTLGLNTGADPLNRLAVAADATLLSHDGAGHQLKINKALATDTASLLFQTGFSGRAEMGTTGDDGFAIKVSADGSTFATALTVPAASGVPDLAAGTTIGGEAAFHRGNALGTVSQVAGVPTGAPIQRGGNANGDFVRFADGTMFCTSPTFMLDVTTAAGAIFRSGAATWTFPMPFIAAPAVFQGRQNHSTAYWTVPGVTTTTTADVSAMSYQSIASRAVNLAAFGFWF